MSAETKVEESKVETKAVEQPEYLLTVKIKFTAMDDSDARYRVKRELADLGIRDDEMENVKFQRLVKNGPPTKVEL